MKTADIRKAFLEYFRAAGHTIVPSSALIPAQDPTLLFTNAGMVQFKDVFLGLEEREYQRAVSCQRCMRAGGKHNDLENVGYTARHHTFFEMLGNFSFGSYFKREAIQFAWNFLTQVLKIPADRLWVTVYEKDEETENIWLQEMKIDAKRFSRCGMEDNFWAMGETGPCGPCTEIYFDHGDHIAGGPPGSGIDGDRFVEIWNLVFMQFNRSEDGVLMPLPRPAVDTGMGLERVAAVMQGVHNNYDIDIFQFLVQAAAKTLKTQDLQNKSLRVIADHIRATVFLIHEGIVPNNEGRGYVLRRIMRRALRHGHSFIGNQPFFHTLVSKVVQCMGDAYPELQKNQEKISQIVLQEEVQFSKTLEQGLKILEQDIATLTVPVIPGETLFRLYDTYGFPVDLTADLAKEKGLQVDMAGFERLMESQRVRARDASRFGSNMEILDVQEATPFKGYEGLETQSVISNVYQEGQMVTKLSSGEKGTVILQETPFYAESGGQIGDQGEFVWENGIFVVEDTQKQGQTILHRGYVQKGQLEKGTRVAAQVNTRRRIETARNHSATHLLHAALRKLLGTEVQQKGSLVAPDRLRFDFTYQEPLSFQQLRTIERLVNEKILENTKVHTDILPLKEAQAKGAMALFGEKYDKDVRVLTMGGEFSKELCGGTHVHHTGDIGLFYIVAEYGIASGIRRIEAITGEAALQKVSALQENIETFRSLLKCESDQVVAKLQQTLDDKKSLDKTLQEVMGQMAMMKTEEYRKRAKDINGIKVVAEVISHVDKKVLRSMIDRLRDLLGPSVVVLATEHAGKATLMVGVSKECTTTIHAGELVKRTSESGWQGGGRADLAEAGASNMTASQVEHTLTAVTKFIDLKLNDEKSKSQSG